MSICYKGSGGIRLKKEAAQEFVGKFRELSEKYDENACIACDEEGFVDFGVYVRHFFINECVDLMLANIDKIINGQLWFGCSDEDGSPGKPFPFTVFFEIVDGEIHKQTLHTRLSCNWTALPRTDDEIRSLAACEKTTDFRNDDLPF